MLDGKSAEVEADVEAQVEAEVEADSTYKFGPIAIDPTAIDSTAIDSTAIESAGPLRRLNAYRWREAAVLLACLLVWILRRPQQLTRPYVWAEESHVLFDFAHHGWISALHSVGGYEALPSSSLVTLSAQLSFAHLPVLMYFFATLIYLTTIALIVLPESRWGGFGVRAAFAACLALVPANPEVFGVLLYSFWWTTLWPLAILGWKNPNYKLRVPLLVIASLSSPAGGALWVVFLASYLRKRQRFDLISAGVLVPGFLIEAVQTLTSQRAAGVAHAKITHVADQTLRTSGELITRWLLHDPIDYTVVIFLGFALLAFILYAGAELAFRRRDEVAMLWGAAVIYLILSSWPEALKLEPLITGRYFFLPYVALSWALVCMFLRATRQEVRIAAVVLLIVSSFNIPASFSRSKAQTTGHLSWTSELSACESADIALVDIPIYVDGSRNLQWSLDLSSADCRRLAGVK